MSDPIVIPTSKPCVFRPLDPGEICIIEGCGRFATMVFSYEGWTPRDQPVCDLHLAAFQLMIGCP